MDRICFVLFNTALLALIGEVTLKAFFAGKFLFAKWTDKNNEFSALGRFRRPRIPANVKQVFGIFAFLDMGFVVALFLEYQATTAGTFMGFTMLPFVMIVEVAQVVELFPAAYHRTLL